MTSTGADFQAFARPIDSLTPWLDQVVIVGGWAHRLHRLHPALPFCKQPLRDVLMIMRDSGMRNQKEVFRMRWEHLDWGNKRYFV